MNNHAEILEFADRKEYRNWLNANFKQETGIWITFIKGNKQFTANDALEESICFGWIDGLMKSIDEKAYKKYFSKRKDLQKWSEKNKSIFERMVNSGLMTEAGMAAYKAKKSAEPPAIEMSEKIQVLRNMLADDAEALKLYDDKPPSRQKQFAGFFYDAKTAETRAKRKAKIIDALRSNYAGMLY